MIANAPRHREPRRGGSHNPANGQRTSLSTPNNAAFNDHPRDDETTRLSRLYYQWRLRSLSVGDVVAVGEVGLAVGHAGWTLVRGGLNEVRTDEHGTHPLPPDAQRGTGRLPSQEGQDDATRD
jgi:hypothetical protein